MTVDQQFTILNDKLQQLLRQHLRLQKEAEQLREALQHAQQREAQQKQMVELLQQQIAIMKLGSGELNEQDKRDFEKKINQYIRDIDKCIAYLSQ